MRDRSGASELNKNMLFIADCSEIIIYYWDHIHWIVLPCLNPDGYRYSYTSERYWRKNRNTNGGSSCKGVDLNRNYDIQWGLFGTSKDSTNYLNRIDLLKSENWTMWRFLVPNLLRKYGSKFSSRKKKNFERTNFMTKK